VRPGEVAVTVRTPSDYGLASCTARELSGGDARHNAAALKAVFHGDDRGPHRDCLQLGASLALEVSGRVRSPREGIAAAAAAIDGGAARRLLEAVVEFSARSAP